eukprot:s3559_g7.t1
MSASFEHPLEWACTTTGQVQDYRRREANLRSEDEIIRERLQETATQLSAKVQELNEAEAELKHLEQEKLRFFVKGFNSN